MQCVSLGSTWGHRSAGNQLLLNGPANIVKEGGVPRKLFLGLWCVWEEGTRVAGIT